MRRGIKPMRKVDTTWSPELAYAIGLITTDGTLSKDGRHLALVSKDKQQLENFLQALKLKNKIGTHFSGSGKKAFRVQFGDVHFYNFLLDIGLMPNKSKILGNLKIPKVYFFDFLRGHFDGDGTFYAYWDPRWRSSFMFYTTFISASRRHIQWLQMCLKQLLGITGHITKGVSMSVYQLKYAKAESLKLLPKLYYDRRILSLLRKRLKIERALKGGEITMPRW